jgi:deoxyadenosine/deoxycytidine kinase
MASEDTTPPAGSGPHRPFRPDEMSLPNLHIGIAGLIGAGKTTLADALGKVLDLPVYYEPVIDNVYLADFYKDQKKYAFPLQVYLLNKRFQQQQQIIWQGKGGVQDRTIYEDSVFARMLRDTGMMEERDYETYGALFNNMSNFMNKPNLIIYLDVSPEESLRRIKLREREMESSIPLEYLQRLKNAYDDFIQDISRVIPVISVNWSQFQSADDMAAMIQREYEKLRTVRSVDLRSPSSSPTPPKHNA